jgi:hypothetical protein
MDGHTASLNVVLSVEKMDGLCKFLIVDSNVLCGLAMEKTESDCWVCDSYSNRPTKGEINKHFPNLKEYRNMFSGIFQLIQQHSTTFRKKISEAQK